jgi:hypothetical protein
MVVNWASPHAPGSSNVGLEKWSTGAGAPYRVNCGTAPDHRFGLAASSDYRALDREYSCLMTRHDDALRQIAHYRRRLGATPRALPHKFVNEQILAKRYDLGHSDLDQFPAEAENDGIVDETIEAQAPVTPAAAPQAGPPRTPARTRLRKLRPPSLTSRRKIQPRSLPRTSPCKLRRRSS